MPAIKRSASSELVSYPSHYHTSVTLYEAAPESSILRRSKRIKAEVETLHSANTIHRAGVNSLAPVVKKEDETLEDPVVLAPTSKHRRQIPPRKQRAIAQSLKVPHPEPSNWRETYDTIKRMRSNIVAPVDTMGCDQAQRGETDPKSQRFSILVSLMLSSQTRDEVTDAAVSKLRKAVGGTLTIESVLNAKEETIAEAISKVGFWRRKTQYIKNAAQKLRNEFDSDVPKTVEELCSLPGVGPKMAFLALHSAWNINAGIGVDVHVHRITNRLGWHAPPTKTPEETRLNLQSWLPTELHREINHLLVGFGQVICLPVGPRCDTCELSSGLCPSATKVTKRSTKTISKIAVPVSKAAGPAIEIEVEDEKAVVMSASADV